MIFGTEDGPIGAGCIRELADAIAIGVRVAGLDPRRSPREVSGFELIEVGRRNPQLTAILRLGHVFFTEWCW